ncbi:unnamed protein product [Brassicogethes aeneus]|uniref:Renin receptor n=1 Tax=Brassicogethes aeneus TaxID=1431903 RepID=A0A9P0FJ97_BRAAE|nr:unnamed protein product [Brassicogethes aeneus]
MNKIVIFCSVLIATVYAKGEFTVLHHPSSVILKGHDHLKETALPEVYSAVLGYSTEHNTNWQGLYIDDPFHLAQAVFTVVVDGVSDIGQQKGHHFPLKTNDDDARVFRVLEKRVLERNPESDTNLVSVDLSNGLEELNKYTIFQDIKSDKPKKTHHNYLKWSVDEDRQFLTELNLLKIIADKIEEGAIEVDSIPDVFWFKFTALNALTSLYGDNSTVVKEAKQLLNEAILHLNAAAHKAYKGAVFVNVITSDAIHTRRARDVLAADAPKTIDPKAPTIDHNLAKNYSEDYPVIFNMMLWFTVVMIFSLLAICLAIANMDPGRDSIIYRMTSTRMKKDN